MNLEPDTNTRCGFVALVGAPNAGKSTLMNQLVGSKISIVTHKVQTTRAVMRGIAIHDDCQIIFVDTPGIFAPRRRLDEAMVSTAWGSARDADICVLLIDAERGLTRDIEEIIQNLDTVNVPTMLLINKIDAVPRDTLLKLTADIHALRSFEETFMVSALNSDGCVDFVNHLAKTLPAGPYMYPEDQISDLPMRMLAAEVTREKIYLRLHQELPYASHVETEKWEEMKDGSAKVSQVIYVERQSQKKIIIGKNGATIKAISTAARKELCELVEQPVHLFLFVKVREKWGDDPARYREMGLEFPAG
ncbi:MAG: GTPase Era [Rhizobiaceae bacterium]|nr:GTPase Era [Rhizobiaceae bacterium]